jgi:glycosyltransferase involved in cell wall biosynthesis
MMKKADNLFIQIIWGYSPELRALAPVENYFLHAVAVARRAGFRTVIFLRGDKAVLERDPNFDPSTEVVVYTSTAQFLYFVWRHRQALFYVNSFSIRSLIVPWLVTKTIFAGHRSLVRENAWRQMVQSIALFRFKKIRVFSAAEQRILDRGLLRNKLVFSPFAVDVNVFSNHGEGNRKGLVYLGNVTAVKNLPTIFLALAAVRRTIPDMTLSIIGLIKDKNFYQQAREYGVEGSIIEVGFLEYAQLARVLGTYSILVNASSREGQCLSVYEGLLSGLAACLPRIPSFTLPFVDAALFHDVYDAQALAGNILRYMADEDLRFRHNLQCRTYVSTECNPERVEAQLRELFLSLR